MATLKANLIKFAMQLQRLHDKGKTLKEIQRWSYVQREKKKRNVPYLAYGDPTYIYASPLLKQERLREFFNKPAEGAIRLSKYILRVDKDKGVLFQERKYVKGQGTYKQLRKTDLI